MSSADLEQKLITLADDLITKAKDAPVEQSIKIFKELREFYAILTKDPKEGDKPAGRRPTTMNGMRKRIAAASRDGGDDGRTESAV